MTQPSTTRPADGSIVGDHQSVALNQQPAHTLLSEDHPFHVYGYALFQPQLEAYRQLRSRFETVLKARIQRFKQGGFDESLFKLERFHTLFEGHEHHEFIKQTSRVLEPDAIDRDEPFLRYVLACAEQTFGKKARFYNDRVEYRVVRPHCDDNNELHRDHWFPYFTNLVNVYIPMAGSHCDSAMKVVPRSHHWTDEEVVPEIKYGEGKFVKANGVAYSVSPIKYSKHEIRPHRPDIIEGSFMLFSPLMVHGGGDNFSADTRFSFEVRVELYE